MKGKWKPIGGQFESHESESKPNWKSIESIETQLEMNWKQIGNQSEEK